MTYDAREISADLGAPVEIYEFVRGAYRIRLTSADRDIQFAGNPYIRTTLSRSGIESGLEVARANLTITGPRTMEVADWHRVAPPADVITLTIWQRHLGDPDDEFAVIWQGRVVSVEFEGAAASIACENVYTSIRRAGLRRAYQRTCAHVLYSAECRAVPGSFSVAGTISAVSGLTISSAAFGTVASGYLVGGYVQIARASGQFERRAITDHTSVSVTLAQAIVAVAVGEGVTAFPGCDHTTETCVSKFNNLANFGGMPYIPTKNPFDGSPVY